MTIVGLKHDVLVFRHSHCFALVKAGQRMSWICVYRHVRSWCDDAGMATCTPHDVETNLSCRTCGTPVCVDCAVRTPMGVSCDEHAGSAKKDGVRQLLSLPTACAVRTSRGVALLSEAGRLDLATKAAPRAIGWGEQRLLVATADQIALFSESGEPLGTHDFSGERVVAREQAGEFVAERGADRAGERREVDDATRP